MKDVREMRELLRSMQSGEMTVSRGMELLDLWLAGNYRDDMLPPVREGLGEDETPWDRIDTLTQQRDELLSAIADHVTVRGEYMQQRDELLAALNQIANDVCDNTYTKIARAAIAKVKG